jgi:hypothetical protein
VAIAMCAAGEPRRPQRIDRDHDIQLFGELADQRALGRFALLDLAAGKFPQPGMLLARPALLDEHPARAIAQRGGDN